MQAIVQLKTPLKCANGAEIKVLICNVEDYDEHGVSVIFPEGQRYKAKHTGIILAESIESSTWLFREPNGELLAGTFDISF